MSLKAHLFCRQFFANSLAEIGSRRLFWPLFSGALRTPPTRPRRCALLGRARRLRLSAPGPRPPQAGFGHRTFELVERSPGPPWAQRWSHCSGPGAILDAGSSSSAPIYARRCWRSPLMTRYLLAPGSLWILLLRPWALGDPSIPRGRPGRRAQAKVACVVRTGTWSEILWSPGRRVPALCTPWGS